MNEYEFIKLKFKLTIKNANGSNNIIICSSNHFKLFNKI